MPRRARRSRRWKKGDAKRGKEGYEVCGACHLPSGAGRPDGTFPQLAGQHTTVLIKQMADIRAGLRDNPTMYPFAKELTDPQELANVAAYIESLCIPVDHGKYEGPDAAKQIADGKALYEKECIECHKANGEGVKDKFYPVLAGQHYKYLLRQMTEIRDGHRRNANPDMVKIIKKYTNDQLVAISAYQASLVHARFDVQGRRRQGTRQEEIISIRRFRAPPGRGTQADMLRPPTSRTACKTRKNRID
jgi:cytochrome c553